MKGSRSCSSVSLSSMSHASCSPMTFVKLNDVFGDHATIALQRRGYRIGKNIGEGSYCKVKTAFKTYENGFTRKVACKIIHKKKASKDFVSKFLPRELSIIRVLRHPHIVSVLDIIEISDQVYIFMDICEKGDLLDHIRNKGPILESKANYYFKQLVSAVEYLHSMDISHRDLKCENVLLSSKDCVKITDFGFARWCRDSQTHKRVLSETFCGSAAYAAPEILQGIPYNPKMYDVWSLGCILFIMLTATMPFDDSNIKLMLYIQMHRKLTFPSKSDEVLSSAAKKLVLHLLEPDITRRATIKLVAQEPWLHMTFDGSAKLATNHCQGQGDCPTTVHTKQQIQHSPPPPYNLSTGQNIQGNGTNCKPTNGVSTIISKAR